MKSIRLPVFLFTLFFWSMLTDTIAQEAFITTWKTNNPGVTDDFSIEIPLHDESVYEFEVQWGDGTDEIFTGTGAELTVLHTYADTGIYNVSITGTFPRIYFLAIPNDNKKILDVMQWGAIEWESFEAAFAGCYNLEVNATDAPDLSNVTTLRGMFESCLAFNQPINHWDVSNVENMSNLLTNASSFNQPLDNWDVSNVWNMGVMFGSASAFNQPLDGWDVSGVTTMEAMFQFASSFNQSINSWDVSSVENMSSMFWGAGSFNQPIGSWDVSTVVNMHSMFWDAGSFNQPLDLWDVSNVETTLQMFEDAISFNQPLNSWDLPNDVTLTSMFEGATSFNQPLDMWDVSGVTDFGELFFDATSFNQPLESWDMSSATDLTNMFRDAAAFDQSLAAWNITSVYDMLNMLTNCGMSYCNYDETLSAWVWISPNFNIELGADGLQYTEEGAFARQILVDDYGWTIVGDELLEDVPEFVVNEEVNGTEISITASGGSGYYTYAWSGPNGFSSTDSSIVAPENGTYTVIVSDGCEEWSDSFEMLSVGLATQSFIDVRVYPNPAFQLVQISSDDVRATNVQIYDTRGALVATVPFAQSTISIDLGSFNAGVYTALISDGNGTPLAYRRISVVR